MCESQWKPLLRGGAWHCTFKLEVQEAQRDLVCSGVDAHIHVCLIQ